MRKDQIEILQKAIAKNGIVAQIDMLHEEIGELMQAINKVKRMGGFVPHAIHHPTQFSGGETNYSLAYFALCSEVADVKIMLHQLESMLDPEAIQLTIDRKIDRLNERLKQQKPRTVQLAIAFMIVSWKCFTANTWIC